MSQHKEQFGFLTFAQNTQEVDYLNLAYVQALNVKLFHPWARYAVIVDRATNNLVTDKHKKVFDYVIQIDRDENLIDSQWKLANEWQVFWLTPFKETIKLESDLLFNRPIDHWIPLLQQKDIVLSLGCKDYQGNSAASRFYRQVFDDNHLPDIYNGLMYFKYSKTANEFYDLARQLSKTWSTVKTTLLKNCREDVPSTDVLFALAAKIVGVEKCTIPSVDFINFAHMKTRIQNWIETAPWHKVVSNEISDNIIRINNINQYWPVHYYDKSYITPELINYYEQRAGIN